MWNSFFLLTIYNRFTQAEESKEKVLVSHAGNIWQWKSIAQKIEV